jgi:hypothetical protein
MTEPDGHLLSKKKIQGITQLALRKGDASHNTPKTKCPFTPQSEMVLNLWVENPPGTDSE